MKTAAWLLLISQVMLLLKTVSLCSERDALKKARDAFIEAFDVKKLEKYCEGLTPAEERVVCGFARHVLDEVIAELELGVRGRAGGR